MGTLVGRIVWPGMTESPTVVAGTVVPGIKEKELGGALAEDGPGWFADFCVSGVGRPDGWRAEAVEPGTDDFAGSELITIGELAALPQ
jgi:hypothetical protein